MRAIFLSAGFATFLAATTASAAVVDGSAAGVFNNPQPAGKVSSGAGTSVFDYGLGDPNQPNRLTFTGASFTGAALGAQFKIGALTFSNGTTSFGSEPTSVDLDLTLSLTSPLAVNVPESFTLNLVTTPNTGTPQQNADFVFFPTTFGANSFLIGGTNYTVELLGFGNISGNGFLDSNDTQLHVLEGSTASADLFARVTAATVQTGVPEPSTWALLLLGFAGLGAVRYRTARA